MSETKQIYSKMSEVMKEIGAIDKDQKNAAQGFKFRGIDQFVNALYPALVKHKVFMAPRVTKADHEIRDVVRGSGKAGVDKHVNLLVEYTFYTEDGSSVTVGPIAAEGVDSGDKSTNKALSAALKYALIQTFMIPTVDMTDGDSESPELGQKMTESKFAKKNEAAEPSVNPATPAVNSAPKASSSFRRKTVTTGA